MPEEELGYLGSLGVKQIDGTPRPHFDLKVKTSVYDKPIKAVALMDTGSCATVVKPHVLPKEMWAPFSKKFAAANRSYGSDFGPSASSGIPASILVGLGGKAYTLPPGSSEFRSSSEYLPGTCVDVLGWLPKLTKVFGQGIQDCLFICGPYGRISNNFDPVLETWNDQTKFTAKIILQKDQYDFSCSGANNS
ncbi:hypothetical protein Ahy_B02g058131 [Arachis hypogaea]|uniref:Uncharacterized protein n=1 Tax=Arachis hypogaea TaxID=3818 RepID=A0A445ADY2_ARAHY|nr:hypothetical protein Ahy_B02g058131 [Arachis hypogaea]